MRSRGAHAGRGGAREGEPPEGGGRVERGRLEVARRESERVEWVWQTELAVFHHRRDGELVWVAERARQLALEREE